MLKALNPHFEHILLMNSSSFSLRPPIPPPVIGRKIPFDFFDGRTNQVHFMGDRSVGSSLNEETNTDKYDGGVNF